MMLGSVNVVQFISGSNSSGFAQLSFTWCFKSLPMVRRIGWAQCPHSVLTSTDSRFFRKRPTEEEKMDTLISLFKIVAIISAALFGALGLLARYKDESGKITKSGKLALSGIVLSLFVSLGLQILETEKAKRDAKKAEAAANQTRQQLEQIIQKASATEEKQIISLGKTERIAEGMEASIKAEQSLLGGNNRILTGLRSTSGELEAVGHDLKREFYVLGKIALDVLIKMPGSTLPEFRDRIRTERVSENQRRFRRESQILARLFPTPNPVQARTKGWRRTFLNSRWVHGYFSDYQADYEFRSYLDFAGKVLTIRWIYQQPTMKPALRGA
jgi:hypothetical protein